MSKSLVIIPHYNKLSLLKECILYLKNQNSNDFDIMIVDNGSTDGSKEYIRELCDKNTNIKSILLDENLGFAGGVNKGFDYSLENSYKYSVLLNNDAFVHDGFVSYLENEIDTDKNLFAVSSMMLKADDESLIDSFGDNYCILGWQFQNHIGEKQDALIHNEYSFSACGGASIYRNEILKKIGKLDETFFAYFEDIDLSYRAKLNGYKIKTCYKAKCKHLGSATSGSKYNDFKVKISARNSIYLIYKNMPLVQIILNFLPLLIGYIIKYLFFLKIGFGICYIAGIKEGLTTTYKVKKNDFTDKKFIDLCKIEIELIINTFKYILNFIKRHI